MKYYLPKLFLAGLAFLATDSLHAGEPFTPGKLELYPTWSALGIELAYTGDDGGKATASFVWRKMGEDKWRNGVDMTIDRKHRLVWASVWPLEQGDVIQVKISVVDASQKTIVLESQAIIKTLNLEPKGGRELYVSPAGDDANPGSKEKPFQTLAHAGKQAKPGDIVYAMSGVYAEGDLFQKLKGTAEKPIVFAAAPGQKPILDSSIVLEKDKGAWKDLGAGVFAASVEFNIQAGGYVAQDGLRMFPYASLADLKADKLKVARAWFYDAKKKLLYVRTGTGMPASRHTYNLSRHAYAVHLTGSQHVVIRGFTMRYYGGALIRLSEGAQGCLIVDNTLANAPGAIFMKSETTRDNAIWRNHILDPGSMDFSWSANYAVAYANQAIYCTKCGRGNSFCHNRIHDWFDLIAVESWKNPDKLAYNRDCDILFNELYNATDDAIEVDGGGVNMRVHGNRIRYCHTAISLAPIERGPVYVTRNDATFLNMMFKFNVNGCTSLGPTYIYHNSGYCLITGPDGGTAISFPPTIPCSNKVLKNNIFIANEWSVRAGKKGYTLDYNCYYHVPGRPPRRFQWDKKPYGTIADFNKATGQEKHGLYDDPKFTSTPDIGKIQAPSDLGNHPPRKFGLAPDSKIGDLSLIHGSPCIDRGMVIRGINEDFSGKGPDIGAFERKD